MQRPKHNGVFVYSSIAAKLLEPFRVGHITRLWQPGTKILKVSINIPLNTLAPGAPVR